MSRQSRQLVTHYISHEHTNISKYDYSIEDMEEKKKSVREREREGEHWPASVQ